MKTVSKIAAAAAAACAAAADARTVVLVSAGGDAACGGVLAFENLPSDTVKRSQMASISLANVRSKQASRKGKTISNERAAAIYLVLEREFGFEAAFRVPDLTSDQKAEILSAAGDNTNFGSDARRSGAAIAAWLKATGLHTHKMDVTGEKAEKGKIVRLVYLTMPSNAASWYCILTDGDKLTPDS